MKTGAPLALIGALIAGCTAQAPVSSTAPGVGFSDYASYEQERLRREALITGTPLRQSAALPQTSLGANPNTDVIPQSELAAAGIGVNPLNTPVPGAVAAPQPDTTAAFPATTQAATFDTAASALTPAAPAPVVAPSFNNPEISDEQDFSAVTARETIESDAQRREQQQQNLIVVEPVPLPTQRADAGPNIVQYAISAPNARGQQWYSRSLLSGDNRFQRNCATYTSPDAAQRDFLARGGPERDPRGIDPDGDGFACGWDPAPFKGTAGN